MLRAIADTHAIIWYLYDDPRLSATARTMIEDAATVDDQIGLSTITLAEILHLAEKERILPMSSSRLLTILDRPRPVLLALPFGRAVAATMAIINRDDVPDLPDRIIAATAQHYEVPLITRDRQVRLSGLPAIS